MRWETQAAVGGSGYMEGAEPCVMKWNCGKSMWLNTYVTQTKRADMVASQAPPLCKDSLGFVADGIFFLCMA